MTIQIDVFKDKLNTPILANIKPSWELVAYAVILILAIVTRFYDLGARVMSHDESLHTLYSWNLYFGKGYQHDPLMHGPFLFHINALMYFLFGDNDFTARISTALLGTVLVMLPYWFRPWLGRIGALAASLMILMSPGLMYYSRYIRHDIFISVWTVLMMLGFFGYMRTRASHYMYITAAAVALMLSTKEVAYIHGFLGFMFILLTLGWEIRSKQYRRIFEFSIIGLIVISASLALFLSTQTVNPEMSETMAWLIEHVDAIIAATIMFLASFLLRFTTDTVNRPVTGIAMVVLTPIVVLGAAGLIFFMEYRLFVWLTGYIPVGWPSLLQLIAPIGVSLLLLLVTAMLLVVLFRVLEKSRFYPQLLSLIPEQWPDLVRAGTIAAVIFTLLHTTFFSNIRGLYSGTWGEIDYWLAQHGVERGGQPWYYYLLMTPLYEFLPLTVALIGLIVYFVWRMPSHADEDYQQALSRRDQRLKREQELLEPQLFPSDGGTFAGYVFYWATGAFVIYSWAGEKMPWLTIHMTLPAIFMAAHIIQTALHNFEWQAIYRKGGAVLGLALLLLIPAGIAFGTSTPFQGQSATEVEQTAKFMAACIVLIILVGVIYQYSRRLTLKLASQVALVTVLLALSFLTIRFAWMLNFVNYDYASEPLVYAHGAPDVKLVLQQIDEISRRTVGDKMIKVAYDNDSTWPLEWYMREYPNRAFYGDNPNRNALDAQIVIVGAANESKVKPYLGNNYTRFNYRMVWWPIEDYKNLTLDRIWADYISGPSTEPDAAKRSQMVWDNWGSLMNIIFYRRYENHKLTEWPFVHRFNLYIRNDVLNEIWDYQPTPLALPQVVDPYEGKEIDLSAVQTWGSPGDGDGQFKNPRTLAVAPNGNIYVADSGNHRIQVFDADGNFLFKWGVEGGNPGQLNEPWGIAIGLEGQVYVADTWNHRIQIFTAEGDFVKSIGSFIDAQGDVNLQPENFWGPRDIAVDSEGNFYVADTGNKRIQKFSPDGEFLELFGGGGVIPGTFEEPVGLQFDSEGNIFVADTWNHRMQKLNREFISLTEWPVVGWDSESIFNKPYVAIDEQNRIFVTDPEGYRIIVYDGDSGDVINVWGLYGQDLSSFGLPNGLDFNQDGQLLVADADNHRILKFDIPF